MFKFIRKLFAEDKRVANGHDFSDEERDKALETRQKNRLLKLQEKQLDFLEEQIRAKQIQAQIRTAQETLDNFGDESDVEDESDDNNIEDALLMSILAPLSRGVSTNSPLTTNQQKTDTPQPSLISDDEIKRLVDTARENVPAWQQALFKSLSPETQKNELKKRFPNYDDTTIEKAIEVFNNG